MDPANLLRLPAQGLVLYLLLLVRFTAMMVTAPLLSYPQIPQRVKIGLGMLVALILLPLELQTHPVKVIPGLGGLVAALAGELAVGLIIGFVAMLVFHGIQFAGYMIGLQMGFGMDQMLDPTTGQEVTSLALFLSAIATIAFLLADGHHWLLLAMQHTLDAVPPGTFVLGPHIVDRIIDATSGMFQTVFTLLMPVLGILLLVELALAIMNRLMPQLNVFTAGFGVKIGVGFLTIGLGLPLIASYFDQMFAQMTRQLFGFFS